jgi:hypothetical protein
LRDVLYFIAQSIFAVEPSAWARWKGILIKNILKNKRSNNNNIFLFGVTENGITQKDNFNIFQTW